MSDDEAGTGQDPVARPVGEDVRSRARALVVALDGPAGSGKSSVAAAVAAELGATHLDTGAIYRAITLACMEADVDLTDGGACAAIAADASIEQRDGRTMLAGRDVEDAIRGDLISANVSTVSAHAPVRMELLQHQRSLAADGAVVEGRDIGTVVLPDADLKVFLTASPEERARRRHQEELDRGGSLTLEAVRQSQARRDEGDRIRPIGRLEPAADAVVLETDGLSREQVLTRLVDLVGTRLAAREPR
jgi:cytidylate kinase